MHKFMVMDAAADKSSFSLFYFYNVIMLSLLRVKVFLRFFYYGRLCAHILAGVFLNTFSDY